MSRQPRVTAGEIAKVAEKLGFELVRQSGSHRIYRDSENRRITVPFHAGDILHPKTLSSILHDMGIDNAGLERLLKEI
jgi:predicted RNA binding protein YcfA (HicA-like mRNA interferase family)